MSRRSELPQKSRHIQILEEDWDYLCQVYGPGSPQPIGPGPAIKMIVHGFVKRLKQKTIDLQDQQAGGGEA